jgi:hypothetical protein
MILAQQAPELLKEIEDTFRVKFKVGGMDLDAQQSRMRLDAMKRAIPQALAMAQAMGDEMVAMEIILQAAPIKKYDNHDAAIRWLIDWTKQDEGMEAHPILQMAVDMRIEEHQAAIQGLQAEQVQNEQAMMAPVQEQAKQQAAEQMGMEMEAKAMEAEQQAAIRDEERAASLEDKAIDEEVKERDHERQMEMEAVKQEGAKELEQIRAKGRAKGNTTK